MKLFVYCSGGFGKEVLDLAKRINHLKCMWDEICYIDDNVAIKSFYDTKVFNLNDLIRKFELNTYEVIIANGEPFIREKIYEKLKANNIKLATIVDDTAIVSDTAQIGEGVIIQAYCFVSSSAKVGNNSVININALVGHDVKLEDNCVVSPIVNIAGNCSVGQNSYIGMGAQIKQGTKIGREVIVGMGSVVHYDIPDCVIALGNPARPMKKNVDKKVF